MLFKRKKRQYNFLKRSLWKGLINFPLEIHVSAIENSNSFMLLLPNEVRLVLYLLPLPSDFGRRHLTILKWANQTAILVRIGPVNEHWNSYRQCGAGRYGIVSDANDSTLSSTTASFQLRALTGRRQRRLAGRSHAAFRSLPSRAGNIWNYPPVTSCLRF